ncbi:MAG: ATP synthase F1 subunit gamma [Solirubrobacterales bacterium]|nr:ATP synthase F1 subunit gamma [Solirubrobacterales bacterium]
MASQRDVKQRVESVRNIQKITSAMEMVAAARLRRAETRIASLRPYAGAIRRMTRQAAAAAGSVPNFPILEERAEVKTVGILLVTGDRGLAGAFNSQIIRAGIRAEAEHAEAGRQVRWYASGRRGVSSLTFRGKELAGSFAGFTDRPAYGDARTIAERLMADYIDGHVDEVQVFYNGYVSALTQVVRAETLLPLQRASVLEEVPEAEEETETGAGHALTEYEPDPDVILHRLIPDYVEISIFRSLLESTASEHGARMTAMRNASENASDVIEDLTLEMNRARQAEITQEIMEVVAGSEALV